VTDRAQSPPEEPESPSHFDAVSVDRATVGSGTLSGTTVQGAPPLQSERSFARLPTEWDDEGTIYSDGDVDTVIFPHVVAVGDHVDDALGQYYLYYASYHEPDGVRLAYADDLTGEWRPCDNPIVTTDHAERLGDHVSTPWVLWEPESDRFVMYAHSPLGGGQQGTIRLTSADGLDWTYRGVVLEPQNGTWDEKTRSYLRAYRYGSLYVGLYMGHRHGSPEGAQVGFAWSHDGRDWRTKRGPLFQGRHRGEVDGGGAYARASLFEVGNQLFVLAGNQARETVEVGPLYDLDQPMPAMQDTNLPYSLDSYAAFRTPRKLYLVGATDTDVHLYSTPWGELL
jgi:hypothetical protein